MVARPPYDADLAELLGPHLPVDRPPRVVGLFAHPDDEVFCMGGTIARAAAAGAETAVVSLTQGEAGQIRDSAVATRRSLGRARVGELQASAAALGVARAECCDLGDGQLARLPFEQVVDEAHRLLAGLEPDVVVTFAADGAFGHPDHTTSASAALAASRRLPVPPRVLQARFPRQDRLLLDLLVGWLTSGADRFVGRPGFAHALRLFADGSSMLGFAADHLHVEWFPPGSYVIEQGEPATQLFCILSGTVDIVVEDPSGHRTTKDSSGPGSFVGEDGLASGRPRNAHVVARDDVTCFVLSPRGRDLSAARGATAVGSSTPSPGPTAAERGYDVALNVTAVLDRKVAALVAHRSQYALDPELLPRQVLGPLLGTEFFSVVD